MLITKIILNLNNYIRIMKRIFMLIYYKYCLRETIFRIIKGEQNLELASRFFNYKIYKLSNKKTKM